MKFMPKRGRKRGEPNLTLEKKEQVKQSFALTDNKHLTARECGVSVKTVYSILKKMDTVEIEQRRLQTLNSLASKLQNKAVVAIDAIGDNEFQTTVDADGRRHGPNLMQKTTALAILTDKARMLDGHLAERRSALETGPNTGSGALLPGDVPGLVHAIRNKIQSLKFLQIDLKNDRTQEIVTNAENAIASMEAVSEDPDLGRLTLDQLDGA